MTEEERKELVDRSLADVTQTLNHYHLQQANGVVVSEDRLIAMCKNLGMCLEAVTYVLENEND